MKDIEQNTELPLFESDNYKRNFPEDFEGEIYSEYSSTISGRKTIGTRGKCTKRQI